MTAISQILTRVAIRQAEFTASRARDASLLAPEFTLFQFIKDDELQFSNIIAWLLNPSGSHGQGPKFLGLFAEVLGLLWDEQACVRASVRTEAPTSWLHAARRMDVLIQSGDRAIAIENKSHDAVDQPMQVQDYLAHLDQEFKGSRCVIYLSAKGTLPSPESISVLERERRLATNELLIVDFGRLLPWIEACKAACQAKRISFFLDEIHRYIQQRFSGIRDVTERDQIISEMTSSSEAISASLQVSRATEDMKKVLIRKLEKQLYDLCSVRGWTLSPKRGQADSIRGSGFLIQFNVADQIAFAVGFGNEQRSFFAFGINETGHNPPDLNRILEAMEKAFKPGQVWPPVWPWGKQASTNDQCLPVDGDWSVSDRPWLQIADGALAAKIITAAGNVQKVLAENNLITDYS